MNVTNIIIMNKEFFKTQLSKLTSANVDRKLKLATENGYSTVEEYKEDLKNMLSLFPADKKHVIHNVHILDRSTSMGSWDNGSNKLNMALKGINAEIEELKKDTTVEYLQTIVDFGSTSKCSVDRVPIQDMNEFHTVANGMTVLYQTVGETLIKLKKSQADEKVLVKIFTDGGENRSTGMYKKPAVLAELIKECEDNGFTITFVGTNIDVKSVVSNLSIDASNTLSHDNTSRGVQDSFEKSMNATTVYTSNIKAGKSVKLGFYKNVK